MHNHQANVTTYTTILLVSRGFSFLNHSTLSVGSPTGIRRHSKWAVCPSATASMFWSGCVNTGRCRVCGSWNSGRWNGVAPSSWRIFSRPSGRCDSSIMLPFAARWTYTLINNCSKWNTLYFVSSEILTTVSLKIQVFWYKILCQWMSVSDCSTGTWCIHLPGLGNARRMPNMGDIWRGTTILVWLMKARSNCQTQWGSWGQAPSHVRDLNPQ